jgi:hypothetical protein
LSIRNSAIKAQAVYPEGSWIFHPQKFITRNVETDYNGKINKQACNLLPETTDNLTMSSSQKRFITIDSMLPQGSGVYKLSIT